MLPLLNVQDIESLISSAIGPVSYLAEWGSKTTAVVSDGKWTSKQYARDYMADVRRAETPIPEKPIAPIATGVRALPYTGPFPRGKHSHRCIGCGGNAVACYKSQCKLPQLTGTCSWCQSRYAACG